ncbi:MAG TPA: hypothetical protein PKD91_01650 [Bacteroidia bacterium]|nr:hypothetical protein [Bacteroidia bacterium]
MKYFTLFTLFFLVSISTVNAQNDEVGKVEKEKRFNHDAGIQINLLMKQLINLSDDNSFATNPYLINYSIFESRSQWGLQFGVGYNYDRSEDDFNAPGNESKLNDLSYRIGIAHLFNLSKKWETTMGVDFTGKYVQSKIATFSVVELSNGTTDSTATFTNNITKGYGGGLQFRLGYKFNKRIAVSTEATLYYTETTEQRNVILSQTTTNPANPANDSYTVTTNNVELVSGDFKITVPVTIFLSIKF